MKDIPSKPIVSMKPGHTCKGSIALGTGCMACERCLERWEQLYGKEEDYALKEAPYNPDDVNLVLLTEEHLQRVVKEAVREGIREYEQLKILDRAKREWGII